MSLAAPARSAATSLQAALDAVAQGADGLDRRPRFPREAFAALAAAGAPAATVPGPDGRRIDLAQEWALVRAVARADGSVGRILDGHLNAVERLAVGGADPVYSKELAGVSAGALLLGVWGADPIPGEGAPARVHAVGGRLAISGVKTFCSGAGGLDRALVVAGDAGGDRRLAYVDLSDGVEVDRSWYRAGGMRASESHRVVFRAARVIALIGGPDEILREPWFGRDAIRTAASWAGMADAAVEASLDEIAARGEPEDLRALAAGRMLAAGAGIDAWLDSAAARVEADPRAPVGPLSVSLRAGVAGACREILAAADDALGSRPFAAAGPLDRIRRDLQLFLSQHRLAPMLAREGRRAIEERR